MMSQNANPLKQYFRQPAVYLNVCRQQGQFWPQGSLEMPANKELPVLPMTAIDEITYRTRTTPTLSSSRFKTIPSNPFSNSTNSPY
jgi:hypothetical protein